MYYDNNNSKSKNYIIIGAILVFIIIAVIVAVLVFKQDTSLTSEELSHNALIESYAVPECKGAMVYSYATDIAEYNRSLFNNDLVVKVMIKNDITYDDSQAVELLKSPTYTEITNTDSIISVGRYMGIVVYSDRGVATTIMYTKR